MRRLLALAALVLAGCVSVDVGKEPAAHVLLTLRDVTSTAVQRRAEPLVNALLIQPQSAHAVADTLSIAYSRREHEFAFYQYASWTERPVRQLPRLLQRRLEASGVAGAVGLVGDPLGADWLLSIGIDALHHDVSSSPGAGRVALTADLFDRRTRTRIAHRRFEASVPAASADSSAAAQAMSESVTKAFDELQPWLEVELKRASPQAR